MKQQLNLVKNMLLGAFVYALLSFSVSIVKAELVDIPKDELANCAKQGGCYLIPMFIIHALLEQNNNLREEIDEVEEKLHMCQTRKRNTI